MLLWFQFIFNMLIKQHAFNVYISSSIYLMNSWNYWTFLLLQLPLAAHSIDWSSFEKKILLDYFAEVYLLQFQAVSTEIVHVWPSMFMFDLVKNWDEFTYSRPDMIFSATLCHTCPVFRTRILAVISSSCFINVRSKMLVFFTTIYIISLK